MKRPTVLALVFSALLGATGLSRVALAACGVFTDVSPAFCPFVLEMYYLGITAGTSPTTFSPNDPVTRGQAAVFVGKGIETAIQRSSRRAALGQWWTTTPRYVEGLGVTTLGPNNYTFGVACDGTDVWVAKNLGVDRVRASDGKLLESWTVPTGPSFGVSSVFVAMGRVFATTVADPGPLFMIDPSQPAGAAVAVAPNVGPNPGAQMAFDGSRLWIPDQGLGTSPGFTIVTPTTAIPWTTNHIDLPLGASPLSMTFDGTNVWLTDQHFGTDGFLKRLDSAGTIIQTVPMSSVPGRPAFDGANLWIPLTGGQVAVMRVSDGTIVATLSGNGLTVPNSAAFDGERVLIVNQDGTISLFRASNLAPIANFPTGFQASNACSDGLNFWIPLSPNQLARY